MNNILVVAYYFPPLGGGGTQRTLKFAKYLPNFGWNPIIFTVKNSHYLVMDSTLVDEIPKNLQIVKTSAILPARFFRKAMGYSVNKQEKNYQSDSKITFIKKGILAFLTFFKNIFYTLLFVPDEYIGWLPFAVLSAVKLIKTSNIGLIFTTSPPNSCHLIGWALKWFTGKFWVVDFRDLWDQYPDNYNPFHLQFKRRLDDFLERKVIFKADRIIVVSEVMKTQIVEKYPEVDKNKISIIMNGYDSEDFESLSPILSPDKFVIVHSGTLFHWRKATHFLQAIKNLLEKEDFFKNHLLIKFLGIVNVEDQNAIKNWGLEPYVQIMDYLPHKESLRHLLGAELLLLIVGDIPNAKNMVTSKVFDYIAAKKPILSLAHDCVVNRIIQKNELGSCVSPYNVSDIEKAIAYYFRQYINSGIPYTSSFDGNNFQKYQRRYLTERLSQILEELIS
ncbi:MAG: glycosyltransferase [bacterium]